MSSASWYIIAYDIRDPRRLRRVQQFLRTCCYPLQRSVFAWYGDHRQLVALQRELTRRIKPSEDDVRGYPVWANTPLLWWGRPPLPDGIVVEGAPAIARQDVF